MKNLPLVLAGLVVTIALLRVFQVTFLNTDFHTMRGISLIREKKYEEAITLFRQAEKGFPCANNLDAHLWLGRCYCDLKLYGKAVQECDAAIRTFNQIPSLVNPESHDRITCLLKGVSAESLASTYVLRGFSYMALNNYSNAIADFTQYIDIMQWRNMFYIPSFVVPGGGYARYLRSICYYGMSRPQLAQKDLERLKKDGYWGYLLEGSRPDSSNWYQLIQAALDKSVVTL